MIRKKAKKLKRAKSLENDDHYKTFSQLMLYYFGDNFNGNKFR